CFCLPLYLSVLVFLNNFLYMNMKFLYKTMRNIIGGQCNNQEEEIESTVSEVGEGGCDTPDSTCKDDTTSCSKSMKIIKTRKVSKHSPEAHANLGGACQIESYMEVNLSPSITGLNINSPQGETCIEFQRGCSCGCSKVITADYTCKDKAEKYCKGKTTNYLRERPKPIKKRSKCKCKKNCGKRCRGG
ncbi:hypothetical protein Ahia01_001018500, partial [Argonauta hians]